MDQTFFIFWFWKLDQEQNELDSVFEEELSDDISDNSLFNNDLNSPLKNLKISEDNDNNNNNNTIVKENIYDYFFSDDYLKN
jgi:hypothetical protein